MDILFMIFIANDKPTKVVQPSEEAFDFPALPVASHAPVVVKRRAAAARAMRSQQDHVLLRHAFAQWVTVVGLVGDNQERTR